MSDLPKTFRKDFHDVDLCRRMEYRILGRTGLEVSKLALGGGTLSELYGDLDLEEATQTIIKALKSGINYIDTAPFYGQGGSEEVLGRALKCIPRETYYIATKVGRYTKSYQDMFDYSATKTRESIHDIEFAKDLDVVLNECLPELEEIVKEGKAKFIGVTGYPLQRLKECIEKAPGRFDVVLSYARYTLLDNELQSYIDFFQQQQLGIICASAHALGLLTNAGPQAWHPASGEQKQLCRKASEICREANVELGKLAMYYSMQLKGATTFLTGMQTRQLLEINLSTLYDGLSQKEQEMVQLLRETVFTRSINWEGNELKLYWMEINRMQ